MIKQNIQSYFNSLFNKQDASTPQGICPTCWGVDEWDGHFYEVIKDKHTIPGSETYASFISKVVDKYVKTTHTHEDRITCLTCDKEIS